MMRRRELLLAALASAALPLRANEAFDTLDLDWRDEARGRPVPVRVYRPRAEGPWPLVVFSHGIGGSRLGYGYLGRHFAAHGVMGLHLQHVGSDRALWGGNPFDLLSRLQGAAAEREALARVHDVRHALDEVLASPLGTRFDAGRIVAAGHSYGANTTLLLAGARVEREGRPVALRDDRLRAAIVMSAPPFHGEAEPQRILAGITLPSLHVTATEDDIRIPGYGSGAADRIALYEQVASVRKVLAVYEGGSHSIFTDRATTGGVVRNPQVKAATQQLAMAFLGSVFDGDDGPLQRWREVHAPLIAQYRADTAPPADGATS